MTSLPNYTPEATFDYTTNVLESGYIQRVLDLKYYINNAEKRISELNEQLEDEKNALAKYIAEKNDLVTGINTGIDTRRAAWEHGRTNE